MKRKTGFAEVIRLGGPLTGDAWVFLAQMALDRGDGAIAHTATVRAKESGVDAIRIDALEIERLIRTGKLEEAKTGLTPSRVTNVRKHVQSSDLIAEYLSGMLAYREARFADASRHFLSVEPWLSHEIRGKLKIAAVNWMSGDEAQALEQLGEHLNAVPGDWVALDLAAEIYTDIGALERAREIVAELYPHDPGLARYREYRIWVTADDLDAAYTIVDAESAVIADTRRTAIDLLFGAAPEHDAYAATFDLLVAISQLRPAAPFSVADAAKSLLEADPLALVLAGENDLLAGAHLSARDKFLGAAKAAPGFVRARLGVALANILTGEMDETARTAMAEIAVGSPQMRLVSRKILAGVHAVKGEYATAADLLRPMEEQLLTNAHDAIFYARLLTESQDGPALIAFGDLARRKQPESRLTGWLVEASGRASNAAKLYRAAFFADPSDVAAAADYARVMSQLGKHQEARSLLRAAMRKRSTVSADLAAIDQFLALAGDGRAAQMPIDMPLGRVKASERSSFDLQDGYWAFNHAVSLASANSADSDDWFRASCFLGAMEGCQELRESDS